MTDVPVFRTGADEAEKAAARASFNKLHWASFKEGAPVCLRFLTEGDAWRTADQHALVPTRPKPDGYDGDWPQKLPATCRRDKNLKHLFADCWICDNVPGKDGKATTRTWAVAVVRELVYEGAKLVGVRTRTREEQVLDEDNKPTGDTREVPDIVIVNMGWKNFFFPLKGFYSLHGTLLDRDYLITRKGSGRDDTDYSIVSLDPIPGFDISTIPNPYNLDEIIWNRATDDYFHRWFDVRYPIPQRKRDADSSAEAGGGAPVEQQAARPSGDTNADAMAAIQARITGYTPGAAAAADAAPSGALQNLS